jgi:hypothetical protein
MWRKIHGGSIPQAVLAVGTALHLVDPTVANALLLEFGEAPDDSTTALEQAIATGGLILTEFPRQAWWRGKLIELDWVKQNRKWSFLFELARQSKVGVALDRLKIDADGSLAKSYLTKLKSTLIGLSGFPKDLGEAIESAGPGTYHLNVRNVPAKQIRLFIRGVADELREWIP